MSSESEKVSKASAPGNLFFLGEHAVVEGVPAIVAAVGLRARVLARLTQSSAVEVDSSFYGTESARLGEEKNLEHASIPLRPLLRLLKQVAESASKKVGMKATIESEIPPECGLSSSSATLCALLAASAPLVDLRINPDDFYEWLYPYQVEIHGGKASGAEIASTAFGGVHRVQKVVEQTTTLLRRKLDIKPLRIVVGDTLVRSPTREVTGRYMRELQEKEPALVERSFARIAALVDIAERAIIEDDLPVLGECMNENQRILRDELGVSHLVLDRLVEVTLQAGALGAKLSGAGRGGVMFALTTGVTQPAIAEAIEKAGGKAIMVELGGPGIEATCE